MKIDFFKKLIYLIKKNILCLVKFEVIYKLIVSLIFIPICIFLFNVTMKITGYSYLTLDILFKFITNPLFLILFILFLFIFTFITIFELTTLIVIFDQSYQDKKVNLIDICRVSLDKCKGLIRKENILLPILVLIMVPFLSIGFGSNFINSFGIPPFIVDYISNNKYLLELYGILYLGFLWLVSRCFFILHNMVIDNMTLFEAIKKSSKLTSYDRIINFLKVFFIQLIYIVVYNLILYLGILILYLIHFILVNHNIIQSIFISLVGIFTGLMLVIFYSLANCINYLVISFLYYEDKKKNKEEINNIVIDKRTSNLVLNKRLKNVFIVLVFLAFIGGSIYTYQVVTGRANLNIEYTKNVEVTAHRGASKDYPENTLSAFRRAKELNADWVELDVQPSSDGKVVVWHDYNLALVSDNSIIKDLTYDEISKIDLSVHFGKKYKDEKIVLLEDVLKLAKEQNIRLNIEIKPKYADSSFEGKVVDLVKKYYYLDMCVFASSNYESLERIKKINPNIKTVYILSIVVGNITNAKYADAYSIEISNVSKSLVKKIHNEGKEVYVWTVNDEDSIKNLIRLGVDNIITDDVEGCLYTIISSKNSSVVNILIKDLMKLSK